MTTPAEETAELFAALQPNALLAYQEYILSRTPARLQALMIPLVGEDPSPNPPNSAVVLNGALIPIQNVSGGAYLLSPATAIVAGGALTAARLPGSSSTVLVQNDDQIVVNVDDVPHANSPGLAVVTGGVLQSVNMETI